MFDIVFDFSASPAGGGRKRALAYLEQMSNTPIRCHFLIHHSVSVREGFSENVTWEHVKRGVAERFLSDSNLGKRFQGLTQWYFAYGVPVYQRVGKMNWFHVSNSLPFAPGMYTGPLSTKLKMKALAARVEAGLENIDMASGESCFSLDLFRRSMGYGGRSVVLRNGCESVGRSDYPVVDHEWGRYAVTIGTAGYKRLDLLEEVFSELKQEVGLDRLVVLGDPTGVSKRMQRRADVSVLGLVDQQAVYRFLANSVLYMSTSEIENSSNAVLEALALCPRAILSSIPSHLEMFQSNGGVKRLVKAGREYLDVSIADIDSNQNCTWPEVVSEMLGKMGFAPVRGCYQKQV